eukprot:scaffold140_cov210-Skeletonema_marinoi.AAC.7
MRAARRSIWEALYLCGCRGRPSELVTRVLQRGKESDVSNFSLLESQSKQPTTIEEEENLPYEDAGTRCEPEAKCINCFGCMICTATPPYHDLFRIVSADMQLGSISDLFFYISDMDKYVQSTIIKRSCVCRSCGSQTLPSIDATYAR